LPSLYSRSNVNQQEQDDDDEEDEEDDDNVSESSGPRVQTHADSRPSASASVSASATAAAPSYASNTSSNVAAAGTIFNSLVSPVPVSVPAPGLSKPSGTEFTLASSGVKIGIPDNATSSVIPGVTSGGAAPALTLPARLDLAASHPNLVEALSALCSWASVVKTQQPPAKAASSQGEGDSIAAFFDSSALEILLRAMFSDLSLISHADVRTAFVTLLQHVLELSAEESTAAAKAVLSSLDEIVDVINRDLAQSLRASSTAVSLAGLTGIHPPVTLGTGVVGALSSRVGQSIRKLRTLTASTTGGSKSAVGGSIQETLQNADKEVNSLNKAIATQEKSSVTSGKGGNVSGGPPGQNAAAVLQSSFMLRDMKLDKLNVLLQVS
jgi:hypothetical protein